MFGSFPARRARLGLIVAAMFFCSFAGSAVAAPPALVGYWPGEGSAADVSGNNNNGVLLGNATFAPGIIGQAFSFDGNNPSSVLIPDSPSLNTTTWSAAAWVKPASNFDPQGGGQVWIFGQNFARAQIVLTDGGPGTATVHWQFGATDGEFPGVTATIPLNAWTYLVGTWDGTTLKLYVNGTLAASQNEAGFTPVLNSCDYHIGGAVNDSCAYTGQFYNGLIDEVRYYNGALSDAAVSALFLPSSKDQCKNGAWQTYPVFKNQGDCVSYVATGGKNQPG